MGFVIAGIPIPGISTVGVLVQVKKDLYKPHELIDEVSSPPPPYQIPPHGKVHYWEPDQDVRDGYNIKQLAIIFGNEIPRADEKQDWPIYFGKASGFAAFIICFANGIGELKPFPRPCCAAHFSREIFSFQNRWFSLYHNDKPAHFDEVKEDFNISDISMVDFIKSMTS